MSAVYIRTALPWTWDLSFRGSSQWLMGVGVCDSGTGPGMTSCGGGLGPGCSSSIDWGWWVGVSLLAPRGSHKAVAAAQLQC